MSLSVHTFNLNVNPRELKELGSLLTADELKRAHRFRFEIHRRRFIAARANLRMTLAEYVGLNPEELRFELMEHGKPYIKSSQNPAGVSFNLSHSNELAAVVICRKNDIGIDLEYLEKDRPFMDLARRYFHEDEVRHLENLSALEFQKAFYCIWTLKEAWLKATGLGIMGLNLVTTVPDSKGGYRISSWGEESSVVGKKGKPSEVRHFEPVPGYIAAYTRLYSSQIVSTM